MRHLFSLGPRPAVVLFAALLAAGLGGCGRHPAPAAPSWVHATLTFTPNPPVSGQTASVDVHLQDGTGDPLGGADVRLRCTMPGMAGMGQVATALRPAGAGLYEGRIRLTMPGRWVATVQVASASRDTAVSIPFVVTV